MASGTPLLGVDVSDVSTTPKFPVGTRRVLGGNTYVYAKAGGTIGAKVPVKIDDTSYTVLASGNGGSIEFVSQDTALASGDYAWFYENGPVSDVNVASGTADNALLARVADANGDFVTVHATGAAAGDTAVRAKALSGEASDVANIYLY